jgi:haloalkane dehalogenase
MNASRPPWLTAALFPYQSRYAEVLDCRVHYVDEGSGPPLLLLHGNPTYCFLYRHLIAALREDFRCIALDYPGFGLSSARAGYGFTPGEHSAVVEAFAEKLDLRGITMMVQDWGGPIGLGFAGRQPSRVRALVIGNTWAWPVNGDPHFERFSGVAGGALGGFLIRNFNAFVNVLLPGGISRKKLTPAEMSAYRGPFPRGRREPTHVFPGQIIRAREYLAEVEANLPRLADRPALIVWGDKDRAFRAPQRERFEALFPAHRTVPLVGASHFIQEDAPEEIATAIRAWWAGSVRVQPPS